MTTERAFLWVCLVGIGVASELAGLGDSLTGVLCAAWLAAWTYTLLRDRGRP